MDFVFPLELRGSLSYLHVFFDPTNDTCINKEVYTTILPSYRSINKEVYTTILPSYRSINKEVYTTILPSYRSINKEVYTTILPSYRSINKEVYTTILPSYRISKIKELVKYGISKKIFRRSSRYWRHGL